MNVPLTAGYKREPITHTTLALIVSSCLWTTSRVQPACCTKHSNSMHMQLQLLVAQLQQLSGGQRCYIVHHCQLQLWPLM